MERCLSPASGILDSCAGTGAYAFYLAERGHSVTAGDLVTRNVDIMRQRQRENPVLSAVYEGDALDLSRFSPGSFDAVLCMGALYHLSEPEQRRRAVEESLRVLRAQGLFICTYMNRFAVIMNNLESDVGNLEEMLTFARDGRQDIFYASTPSEMEALMDACGLERLCHVALDGMAFFLAYTAGLISPKGLERWREYHFATCEEPGLLGAGYHNMIICRKRTG